ncbi:MAG: hypothetical protein ACRDY5_00765 [Acidimicrobiales bacterium]
MISALSYTPLVKLRVGPLAISPHGIFIVVGFFVAAQLLLRRTRAHDIADADVQAILTRAAIGAVAGHRE